MDKEQLTYLLHHPAELDFGQTAALNGVLKKYPFFQAARALRLKGLRQADSLHYNHELRITAAYTTDRSVLFDFITSEEFQQNEIASKGRRQQKEAEKDLDPEKEENLSLDRALKMKVRESEQVFDPELFTPYKKAEEDSLERGRPLDFDKGESHSFSEWLKLSSTKPITRTLKKEPEEPEPQKRKFELIEDFIAKSPRIDPSKSTRKVNLAEASMTAPEALMTETLARVYLEQQNYKKAIQAYKILILKNPEKSGFFADQIRAIEKIQEHNS